MKLSVPLLAGALIGLAIGVAATSYVVSAGSDEAVNQASAGGGPRGGGRGGRGGYAPVVAMAVAEKAAVARSVEVIGRARALKSIAITAEVTGLVKEVNIAPGKRVENGDLLVQIDDAEQQVALQRARAEYPIAKQNADRYSDLQSDAAASELEAEQAKTNYVSVQAQLRSAEVAVQQRKITAPFDGIAGITEIEPGDYLRAGDVVVTLDDTSSIIVEFSVPQESAAYVNIGQPVSASLTSAAAVKFDGEIIAIDSRVDPASRTLRVEARVNNEGGRLIPGAVLAVSTTAEGEPAVSAPGLAVQWDRGGAFVWRRNDEGAAERVSIVILQRREDVVLVEGDLKPGDVIVSEGADRVRGGVPLPALQANSPQISTGASAAGND